MFFQAVKQEIRRGIPVIDRLIKVIYVHTVMISHNFFQNHIISHIVYIIAQDIVCYYNGASKESACRIFSFLFLNIISPLKEIKQDQCPALFAFLASFHYPFFPAGTLNDQ